MNSNKGRKMSMYKITLLNGMGTWFQRSFKVDADKALFAYKIGSYGIIPLGIRLHETFVGPGIYYAPAVKISK